MTTEKPACRCGRTFAARKAARSPGRRSRVGTIAGGRPGPRNGAAAMRAAISAGEVGATPVRGGGASPPASMSNGSDGAPSLLTRASSSWSSALNFSNPSSRTRNLSRLRCLFLRSPRAWNRRTSASASARTSSAGRNSKSRWPEVQREEVPPATVTAKPRRTRPRSSRLRARNPRSWIAVAAWSSWQPSKASLSFRGNEEASGCRRKCRVTASA